MPALSPTMEKGNLAKWLKKEGDKIKSGDVIAEIETDKATMEVEAADEGTLGKILVPEGTADVAVNTPIAVILGEGEDKTAIKSTKPAQQQKAAESAPPAKAQKQHTKTQDAPAPKPAKAPGSPGAAGRKRSRHSRRHRNGHHDHARGIARRHGRGDAARQGRVRDGRRSRRISGRVQGDAGSVAGIWRQSA